MYMYISRIRVCVYIYSICIMIYIIYICYHENNVPPSYYHNGFALDEFKHNSYTYFQKSSAIHKGTLTLQHYNIIANFKRAKSAQQCKISVVLTLKIQIPPSTLHKPKAHKTPLRRCGCHMNVLCKRIKYLSLQ